MRVMAAITDPEVAGRILKCLSLPSRAPPLMPASPLDEATDPWLEEPDVDFDQTAPEHWDPPA
jgi:hypothetical protein